MTKHLAAKTSIGLAALAVSIAGCAVMENLDNEDSAVDTQPTVTVPPDPYQAVLLDGTTMTISAESGADFTEGVPTAIHSLNLLAQAGDCHEIKNHSESWMAQVSRSDDGQAASAYANHANNIYRYIECGKAARPVQAVESQGEIRYDTCQEAIEADGGNYYFGIDAEYDWYEDRDGDGVVCENR